MPYWFNGIAIATRADTFFFFFFLFFLDFLSFGGGFFPRWDPLLRDFCEPLDPLEPLDDLDAERDRELDLEPPELTGVALRISWGC